MRAQLTRVVEAMESPNVKIQVIPYASGAHPALDSVFTFLEFARPAPDVIYVEAWWDTFTWSRRGIYGDTVMCSIGCPSWP